MFPKDFQLQDAWIEFLDKKDLQKKCFLIGLLTSLPIILTQKNILKRIFPYK